MLFGHNPGMTDFVHELDDCPLANLPTCACVTFRVEVDNWAATEPGKTHLEVIDYPKKRVKENVR